MRILNVGDRAPDFTLPDQNGKAVSLKDFRGRRLALYFYPKDMTPGCTNQACNLRDNMAALRKAGIAVLGISADEVKRHKKFEEKHQLPFPLLADPGREAIEAYRLWREKQFMGRKFMGIVRTTFLINEQGIIDHIIDKVQTKNHAAQILEKWS